jgi:DNA-binding transcriptional LysR family regulator
MVDAADAEGVQLPYLETFSKAAELSSFTGAAKALRLSQAAVSLRVQALEKRLGKSLFQRQGGRVLLTVDGQRLYDYAQRILDLHRAARREISGHEAPTGGELFMAASSIPGEHLLPALLSVFRKKHPHIRVHATVSDSMAVMGQVERGDVSLGLVGRKAENPHLEFRHLASDRMVLVIPPGHVLGKRKKISIKQLALHALILREVGSGLRHCFEKSLEKAGRSLADLRVVLELGSNEAIKEAVLQGVGIAVLSTFAVQKEIRSGRLKGLEVTDLHCDRDMFIVHDRRRVLPLPARVFLNFLETNPIPAMKP